jgi:Flp pilus assembly pilin Flp
MTLLTKSVFSDTLLQHRIQDMQHLNHFFNDETGQDLIEYTLLMAFVALASAALFIGAGKSIQGIWQATNSQLSAANASAS